MERASSTCGGNFSFLLLLSSLNRHLLVILQHRDVFVSCALKCVLLINHKVVRCHHKSHQSDLQKKHAASHCSKGTNELSAHARGNSTLNHTSLRTHTAYHHSLKTLLWPGDNMLNVFPQSCTQCRVIALRTSPVRTKWCGLCVTEKNRPLMQRAVAQGRVLRPRDWMDSCAAFIPQKGLH